MNAPPPPRTRRAAAKAITRSDLLDAAALVVSQKGVARASVGEIAAAAGRTTGAVYANFADKDELCRQLLIERDAPAPALLDVAEGDVDRASLQAELWLYALRHGELRDQIAERFRRRQRRLAHDLADGKGTPTDAATVLMALVQGLGQLRRTDPSLVPAELYGAAVRWLFTGITTTGGET